MRILEVAGHKRKFSELWRSKNLYQARSQGGGNWGKGNLVWGLGKKVHFFGLRPYKILKNFACGAENQRFFASWSSKILKIFACGAEINCKLNKIFISALNREFKFSKIFKILFFVDMIPDMQRWVGIPTSAFRFSNLRCS